MSAANNEMFEKSSSILLDYVPLDISDRELLISFDLLGQYGEIKELVINQKNSDAGELKKVESKYSRAYVRFKHQLSAAICYFALNKKQLRSHNINANIVLPSELAIINGVIIKKRTENEYLCSKAGVNGSKKKIARRRRREALRIIQSNRFNIEKVPHYCHSSLKSFPSIHSAFARAERFFNLKQNFDCLIFEDENEFNVFSQEAYNKHTSSVELEVRERLSYPITEFHQMNYYQHKNYYWPPQPIPLPHFSDYSYPRDDVPRGCNGWTANMKCRCPDCILKRIQPIQTNLIISS